MTGVTFPLGFEAAGAACGLKKNGNPDVAMVASVVPAACAGIFTRNVVKGHSLQLCQKHAALGCARAVVVNSGNANACLGERGDLDALRMAQYAADLLHCPVEQVLTGSTGVIGLPLDMALLEKGIQDAYAALSPSGGESAARAIMTTDTTCKQATATLELSGATIRIGAMAKGSGMIHPDMATMISVITTDAAIGAEALKLSLKVAADKSYNRISVDGDTSVCDKVVILANGQAGNAEIQPGSPEHQDFTAVLCQVCLTIARMLASDGEGATKLLEIRVNGAKSPADAHTIAASIARSPLVKTAAFGEDANWGRILTAAGYSGVTFDPSLVDIYIGDLLVCKGGRALPFDEERALAIIKEQEVLYRIELNQGSASDFMLTCDFSYDYVKINGSYRT